MRTSYQIIHKCLPWWLRWKRICFQCRGPGVNPWIRKIPWRKKWLPTPVFLPGKVHGQRCLVGYSLWGYKRDKHDLATKQQHITETPGLVGVTLFPFDPVIWYWTFFLRNILTQKYILFHFEKSSFDVHSKISFSREENGTRILYNLKIISFIEG